jgi:predicted  nucleic acid-binding Zn-ribbon protein
MTGKTKGELLRHIGQLEAEINVMNDMLAAFKERIDTMNKENGRLAAQALTDMKELLKLQSEMLAAEYEIIDMQYELEVIPMWVRRFFVWLHRTIKGEFYE